MVGSRLVARVLNNISNLILAIAAGIGLIGSIAALVYKAIRAIALLQEEVAGNSSKMDGLEGKVNSIDDRTRQLLPNGGTSLADKVNTVHDDVAHLKGRVDQLSMQVGRP